MIIGLCIFGYFAIGAFIAGLVCGKDDAVLVFLFIVLWPILIAGGLGAWCKTWLENRNGKA